MNNVRSPIKVAHLSDLHFRKFGRTEKKLVRTLKEENPDIILVTGDTLDGEQSVEFAKIFFRDLAPPLGVWGVLGNWENWKRLNVRYLAYLSTYPISGPGLADGRFNQAYRSKGPLKLRILDFGAQENRLPWNPY